jgi:hypothetical protein
MGKNAYASNSFPPVVSWARAELFKRSNGLVQAYRQARDRGESELTPFNAAADTALALGRPLDKVNDTARVLIDWAAQHVGEW